MESLKIYFRNFNMFKKLRGLFANDLSIDLGTANTLIYVKSKGIVLNEPSVVAVSDERRGGSMTSVAVGREAKQMLGKTPENIKVVRPMRDGVITDCKYTQKMLEEFMRIIQHKTNRFMGIIKGSPRVLVCVPYGSTPVERAAIKAAVKRSGANEVFLITEPMAAAVGAELPVTEAKGSMVIDIGGGTTEVAIVSLGGVVYAASVRTGGDKLDEAIISYVRDKHRIEIGEVTAENLKIQIGCASEKDEDEKLSMEIRGQSIINQVPMSVTITSEEVMEAIQDPLKNILGAVQDALSNVRPELSADISDQGMVLTGGGALLRNLHRLISEKTNVNVRVAKDPLTCVARGGGAALELYDSTGYSLFERG